MLSLARLEVRQNQRLPLIEGGGEAEDLDVRWDGMKCGDLIAAVWVVATVREFYDVAVAT